MARPKKNIDVSHISNYFNQFEDYSEVPSWIDDILSGCGSTGSSNRSAPVALFTYFTTYSFINLASVTEYVNRKYQAIYGSSLSERYCYLFMQRLVSCLSALDYHFYKRGIKVESEAFYEPVGPQLPADFTFADGVKYHVNSQNYFK